jgi:hypothetical protein
MFVFVTALTVLATPGFLADRAWAMDVSISGKHFCTEIKATCGKAGGRYFKDEKGCGCITGCSNSGNCSVQCTNDGHCMGSVPVLTQPQGSLGLVDVLRGAPPTKQR